MAQALATYNKKLIIQNSFYQNLLQMEKEFPKAYPKGVAQKYLQVAMNVSPPAEISAPGAIDRYVVACFRSYTKLTFDQINERVQPNYSRYSLSTLGNSLRRLVDRGKLIREGKRGRYIYSLPPKRLNNIHEAS